MFKRVLSIFLLFFIINFNTSYVYANCPLNCDEQILAVEHLEVHKDAPCNNVIITNQRKIIEKGNVLHFVFEERYFSKCSKAGTLVHFEVPQALYTQEGTLLFPCGTKILADVTNVEEPKWFNKNARVSFVFKQVVFPDGTCIPIKARPFTCDNKLKEGPWTTAGKITISTLSLGIIGAGAGVGFGFIPNPIRIGTGLAVGIPVGCGVGFLLGVITPGCHYKAKPGENVYAILIEPTNINNTCDDNEN